MPTSLGQVQLCNVALAKIGAESINSLTDLTNRSSRACNANFELAYKELSRSGRWNCLLTTANLAQIPQTPLPSVPPQPFVGAWAPLTTYAANVYLSYGGYYYLVLFTYTSTNNFQNDLTTGALNQTNLPATMPFFPGCDGCNYPSGWAFQFELPTDFQLLAVLNENSCWDFDGAGGDDYEIMGSSLFANCPQANIQYVKDQPDTTQWDSMFSNAFTLKLASSISTALRQDGGKMESELLQTYELALRKARQKNGGETQGIRFNPIRSSRFNQARYGGING